MVSVDRVTTTRAPVVGGITDRRQRESSNVAIEFPNKVKSSQCKTKTNSTVVHTKHGAVKVTESKPVKRGGK